MSSLQIVMARLVNGLLFIVSAITVFSVVQANAEDTRRFKIEVFEIECDSKNAALELCKSPLEGLAGISALEEVLGASEYVFNTSTSMLVVSNGDDSQHLVNVIGGELSLLLEWTSTDDENVLVDLNCEFRGMTGGTTEIDTAIQLAPGAQPAIVGGPLHKTSSVKGNKPITTVWLMALSVFPKLPT